jgi:hypothetical protein
VTEVPLSKTSARCGGEPTPSPTASRLSFTTSNKCYKSNKGMLTGLDMILSGGISSKLAGNTDLPACLSSKSLRQQPSSKS